MNTIETIEKMLASLAGYRKEMNDGQPCDAEKAGRTLLEELANKHHEPNLFWNDDDPEMPYSSIGEFLNDEWCNGGLEVGEIRTVQQAIRLPNVVVRVTSVSEDGDIDYIIEFEQKIKEQA